MPKGEKDFIMSVICENSIKCKEHEAVIIADKIIKFYQEISKICWVDIDKEKPLAYETGEWDGKRTDFLLITTNSGDVAIARGYIGFMDGSIFCDFYDKHDYEKANVKYWAELPESAL